ncbi:hypothetical protein EV368DRAFT_72115 [Lentinula lateritia]|uniref:Uncharacterized protein n=1 Tax=Lentinula aff. lateritia TaxID=2804960 RepID=A0ACC1U9Z1_9AGAR|nr:hypothetical protein F5876DRAFT_87022 [Lentinula aff. lateritia]KAJ3855706.1 hypothetical protein EV368DRAFT_72115 [Lentinula lateritia]
MNNQIPDQPYTFLRIKRKRNEEPLDALVVESGARRKKSKGGTGVFQFAKTIEEGVWEDEEQKRAIQPIPQEAKAPVPPSEATVASTPPLKSHQTTDNRRYTIVERSLPTAHLPLRKPASPPQVVSSKELPTQRANSDFKMYDAVLENPPAQEQIDPALERLLQDYLKLQTPSASIPATAENEDYVWDIFYHRPRTYTQALMDAVAVGTVSGLPPLGSGDSDSDSYSEEEDEADEDSNAEEWYTNDYPEEEESDLSQDDDNDEFHEDTIDSDSEHEWQ